MPELNEGAKKEEGCLKRRSQGSAIKSSLAIRMIYTEQEYESYGSNYPRSRL